MKKRQWMTVALAFALLGALASTGQSALIAGDVVITGVNSDNPDAFAWVPLRPLAGGQVLFFSDAGWINGAFSGTSSDGGVRFTAPVGGLEAGAVQNVTMSSLTSDYQRIGGALGGSLALSPAGDQLVAFANSIQAPEFLFAVNLSSTTWGLQGSTSNSIRSQLYPGLIDGQTAVATGAGPSAGDEYDNVRYEGISRGSHLELLGALTDRANWAGSNLPGSSDRYADLSNGVTRFELQGDTTSVPEPGGMAIWAIALCLIGKWRRGRPKPA